MPLIRMFKMFGPRRPTLGQRIRRFFIYIILIALSALGGYMFLGTPEPAPEIAWGVTFSKEYASSLGLDWRQTYLAILDDLRVSHLRIAVPWTSVEPRDGEFTFDDVHFMMQEASARGVAIIPVIGHRSPRWPECHTPQWAKDMPQKELTERVLRLLEAEMKELKSYDAIVAWQIENEPFFKFGNCADITPDVLGREIERVKSIDNRPIMITDSGELGLWKTGLNQADILGVTMYRWVWTPWFSYVKYPLTPMFYFRRVQLVARAYPDVRVVGSELQAEPWVASGSLADTPIAEQEITMSIEQFKENIEFAKNTGIDEHYLWGAEWWYWMKQYKTDSRYWDEAQRLWR